jgi:hypothetical protein
VAGHLIAVRLQEGLARAEAVVFVVSAESVGRGGSMRSSPRRWPLRRLGGSGSSRTLVGEVALPPMVASRLYIDFRYDDGPAAYEAKLRELAAAIRGLPGGVRPEPGRES